jgi:hypothetical protein
MPLALARLELDDRRELIDLDDPAVLKRERLRPSQVATRQRTGTQPQALNLFRRHRSAAGLRWWSTWEALWANVTVFDRASGALTLDEVTALTLDHPSLLEPPISACVSWKCDDGRPELNPCERCLLFCARR